MIIPIPLCISVVLLIAARSMLAAGCVTGFQDAGGGVCNATFAYSGAPVSVTLPMSVSGITASVSGAEGGASLEEQVDPFGGAPSAGGKGGRETAVIPVDPGATLTIVVGQAGVGNMLSPPGFGGYGGGGHASSRNGGNGGGGSFVFDANGPLLAAGGGGGGGYDYNPVVQGHGDQHAPGGDGSGASAAGDGQSVSFCCDGTAPANAGGGGGASAAAPGLGGHPSLPLSYVFGQADGDPGAGPAIDANSFGNGGSTHNGCCSYTGWAGGGGGGYYGGGGGGNIEADLEGGGGGGGAGYVIATAISSSSQSGVQLGDGEVTISYYTGACHASCVTCSGSTAALCTSCANGLSLVNGACLPLAPMPTGSAAATGTPSETPTGTPPHTATETATETPTRSATATPTASATPSPSPTPTQTPAATPTRTPTSTPTPKSAPCVGDCDASTDVTIDELIQGVNIALSILPPAMCPSFDANRDGQVTIDELIRAVDNALYGCAALP